MSPRKQPKSLLNICIKNCIRLITSACYVIEKSHPENKFDDCKEQIFAFKLYLMSLLPTRLFEILCLERSYYLHNGDPRIHLHVLTHPNMTIFRKCDLDNSVPQHFWIQNLPNFTRLIVLDLKFICTDEILQIIGKHCLLLEEVNIVSKVDVCKSNLNASVLIRNVSDAGLHSIANLKNLRILSMDPPRNERANRVGRCVTQAGIIMLVSKLPYLEELQIESCDVGATLITTVTELGPLGIKKINCHFASAAGIKKLIKICPHLKELSITHLSAHNKDDMLQQLTTSDLRLTRLDLSFFSYSQTMQKLLAAKGSNLTQFALWDIEYSLTIDDVVSIGVNCPNLAALCIMTQSKLLITPRFFKRPQNLFSNLKNLTIGNDNFNIDNILSFFLDCTNALQKLILKYQTKINIDDTLTKLIEHGKLKSVMFVWFDCTIEVSKSVVKQMIEQCDQLQVFTVDFNEDMSDVLKYINDNNLLLKLGIY